MLGQQGGLEGALVADPAQQLHHLGRALPTAAAVHVADHGANGGRTDGLLDGLFVVTGGFHHDRLADAVALLQLTLQFQVEVARALHRDAHDAFLERSAQGTADKGLRQVELFGDLRLLEPFFVVEGGDLGQQALFFEITHPDFRYRRLGCTQGCRARAAVTNPQKAGN